MLFVILLPAPSDIPKVATAAEAVSQPPQGRCHCSTLGTRQRATGRLAIVAHPILASQSWLGQKTYSGESFALHGGEGARILPCLSGIMVLRLIRMSLFTSLRNVIA